MYLKQASLLWTLIRTYLYLHISCVSGVVSNTLHRLFFKLSLDFISLGLLKIQNEKHKIIACLLG